MGGCASWFKETCNNDERVTYKKEATKNNQQRIWLQHWLTLPYWPQWGYTRGEFGCWRINDRTNSGQIATHGPSAADKVLQGGLWLATSLQWRCNQRRAVPACSAQYWSELDLILTYCCTNVTDRIAPGHISLAEYHTATHTLMITFTGIWISSSHSTCRFYCRGL